jgi:hypothetical protein
MLEFDTEIMCLICVLCVTVWYTQWLLFNSVENCVTESKVNNDAVVQTSLNLKFCLLEDK